MGALPIELQMPPGFKSRQQLRSHSTLDVFCVNSNAVKLHVVNGDRCVLPMNDTVIPSADDDDDGLVLLLLLLLVEVLLD